MKWPSWEELISNIEKFEQKLSDNKIVGVEYFKKFQDRHPILDSAFQSAISYLPYPINQLSQQIYDKAENPIEGSIQVYEYLKNLEYQGNEHYDTVTKQLKEINLDMAKEETQRQIKDVLISTGDILKEKLELLRSIDHSLDMINEIIKNQKIIFEKIGIEETITSDIKYPHFKKSSQRTKRQGKNY